MRQFDMNGSFVRKADLGLQEQPFQKDSDGNVDNTTYSVG
jgi:hypothetical protein